MPYRKTSEKMKKLGRAVGRDSEQWAFRALGPRGPSMTKPRTPNLAPFKEPEGRERNEGTDRKRTLRAIRKEAQIRQALREKRGKP